MRVGPQRGLSGVEGDLAVVEFQYRISGSASCMYDDNNNNDNGNNEFSCTGVYLNLNLFIQL